MRLKHIPPYQNTNRLFVKGRWLHRKLLDVILDEFKTRDEQFHLDQIQKGRVSIIRQGNAITGDGLLALDLQNKDILQMTVHKHEPAIVDSPIRIIHDSPDLLVVNKPSSIPVHPTGRYFQQSLTESLRPQYGDLFLCHRLDKLTSGIVILSKSSQLASQLQQQIKDKSVEKYYLARVSGAFPLSMQCDVPVGNIDTKLGFQNGVKMKREAHTNFHMLKYNSELDESIVLCKPLTGRTHQIRIHLNYLGHSIVNDPLYGPQASQLRSKLIHGTVTEENFHQLLIEDRERIKNFQRKGVCDECGELLFQDPDPQSLVLWLHAFRYKFQNYDFEADRPAWCDI